MSKHDKERDFIAANWLVSSSFVCDGCNAVKQFPRDLTVLTEVRYSGGLRADIGAVDIDGRVIGVVEVIDKHRPSPSAFAEQSRLDFAYYRLINLPVPSKRRSINVEIAKGRFRYTDAMRRVHDDAVWLCSVDCLAFFEELKGADRSNDWDAPRCDVCGDYLHNNPISRIEFRDWAYDPYTAFCIQCAARCDAGEMQWRAPGELAGGDPREWTPDGDADPAILFLAYCDAAFWSKVWSGRAAELDNPDAYDGSRHEIAENATAKRLPLVNAAINAGDWAKARDLLLPIGAPAWAAYEDEPERLLAFRADNCKSTAAAWEKLLSYSLNALPLELQMIIRESERAREEIVETSCCSDCGAYQAAYELETGGKACSNCGVLYD